MESTEKETGHVRPGRKGEGANESKEKPKRKRVCGIVNCGRSDKDRTTKERKRHPRPAAGSTQYLDIESASQSQGNDVLLLYVRTEYTMYKKMAGNTD